EPALLAVAPAATDDVPGVVDVTSFRQDPSQSGGNEPVEIAHDTIHDDHCARRTTTALREANDVAALVYRIGGALPPPRQRAEIAQSATREYEGAMLTVTHVAITDHLVAVIEIACRGQLATQSSDRHDLAAAK